MSRKHNPIAFGLGAGVAVAVLFLWLMAIDPNRNVRLLSVALEVDETGARTLVGAAENRTGEPYARLELTVAFLDGDQRVVAWGATDTTGIGGTGIWMFRVPVPPGEVAGFHFADLSCFRTIESGGPLLRGCGAGQWYEREFWLDGRDRTVEQGRPR